MEVIPIDTNDNTISKADFGADQIQADYSGAEKENRKKGSLSLRKR